MNARQSKFNPITSSKALSLNVIVMEWPIALEYLG